ncbi:hypothetical protein Tco_1100022 [Tanacetum coccineum]
MATTTAQQIALDNALVATKKQVKIGKCNMRIDPKITLKEPTYHVATIKKHDSSYRFKIDKKRFSIDMEVFREILQICLRLLDQEFDDLPSEEEILSFIKDLGHTGNVKKITDVDSAAYQTYFAFAIREATPKPKRIYKKTASPTIKTITKSPKETPSKKKIAPAKKDVSSKNPLRKQSTGVQIRDTPSVSVLMKKAPVTTDKSKGIELLSKAALLEDAQMKKALKKSKRDTNIHQASGSSEGANFESEVPNKPKGKSTDTSEGTGVKPGVPDVSKENYSDSENESWGDSGDDEESDDVSDDDGNDDDSDNDDDDNDSDDVRTESDDDKNDDDQEEEYVHTPENYESTDDEEEYEELYKDVNVRLKDAAHEEEGK